MTFRKRHILLSAGIILFIWGIISALNVYMFINSANESSGTIQQVINDPVTAQKYVYVTYKVKEKNIIYKFPIGKNKSYRYPVGGNIQLFYNPDNPYDVKVSSFFVLWTMSLILLTGGILLVIVSLSGRRYL